jgi:hypothetical protein
MMTRPTVITVDKNGQPLKAEMQMRDSESTDSRKKVCFTVPTNNGLAARDHNGDLHELEKVPKDMPEDLPICMEFRLEMN